MNAVRRKSINSVIEMMSGIKETVEEIQTEEQDALDNMPENLQGSIRYEQSEEALSNLELALDSLDEFIEYLTSAQE